MSKLSNHFPKSKPSYYAREVLINCGFQHPPISEIDISNYLNLKLIPITKNILFEYNKIVNDPTIIDRLSHTLIDACAWLETSTNSQHHIWYSDQMPEARKRLSIFHECGHDIIPWHNGINYLCSHQDILIQTTTNKIEKEAFECGIELIMPSQMFGDDLMNLDVSFKSISILKNRYNASFEATAIRFAKLHQNKCSLVVIEQSSSLKQNTIKNNNPHHSQSIMELNDMKRIPENFNQELYPLRIKYINSSNTFTRFFPVGYQINQDNPIYKIWVNGRSAINEIPLTSLGSSLKNTVQAESLKFKNDNKLFLLLFIPDHQESIF